MANRPDCCQDRLAQFGLDFVNAAGVVDRFPTYAFAGSQPSYTITPPGGLATQAAPCLCSPLLPPPLHRSKVVLQTRVLARRRAT